MANLKWSVVVQKAIPIIKQFVDMGAPPTLRSVHYALVSKEVVPNTRSAYQGLSRALVKARKEGILPWDWLSDPTRRIVGGDDPFWEPVKYADAYIDGCFEKLENFRLPQWLDQEYYVEVWIEKEGMSKAFDNWLADMNVEVVPCKGYSSWTFIKKAASRIANQLYDETDNPLIAKYQGRDVGLIRNDRKPIILYFGDFDPSGKDIDRFIAESLSWFGLEIEFKRIAVTLDQIEDHNLPHSPDDEKEIAKMRRDPRFKKWEYGLFRVEMDALFAFVPKVFEEMIKQSVAEYFDEEPYRLVLERQEEEQYTVKDRTKERLEEKMNEFYKEEE